MAEQIIFNYTIVPINEMVRDWAHPLNATHVVYVSGPGIYDKKAVALCLSEADAQSVRDAFTQRDQLLAESNELNAVLGERHA